MPQLRKTIHLSKDGNQFCALLGDNLQEGIAGFGYTIVDALVDLAAEIESDSLFNVDLTRHVETTELPF